METLPPLVLAIRVDGAAVKPGLAAVDASVDSTVVKTEAGTKKMASGFENAAKAGKFVALGALAIGVASIKMASDFQESTTRLVTGAGESQKNIELVRQGLLNMAPAVGMGPTALAKAMFTVESAGYHGAEGLNVMKAAAEGAKIGGADATVVANGLTTALTDYHLPASQAATVTSQLVATVAAGKTTMQDLSTSLSAVLPSASAAGIGLTQVLGAMGTMTAQGISAQQSSNDLANTIRSLQNPSQVQTAAMTALGLSSLDVAQNLGKRGLTGTLDTLVTAITAHMGPSGLVLQDTFKKSQLAAADAKTELNAMPASLQKVAGEFLKGDITSKQWRTSMKTMSVENKQLATQFAATVNSGRGFNDLLKTGGPSAETFSAALSKVTGGSTGMNTALALTGGNMAAFQANVKNISGSTTEAGGHVKGWSEVQKDFATQMAQTGAQIQVVAIKIGGALMPTVQAIVKGFGGFIGVLQTNRPLLVGLVGVLGLVAGALVTAYVAQKAQTTYTTLASIATAIFGDTQKKGAIFTVASTAAMLAQKVAIAAGAIATGIATAAQWAFNAAMDANPIGIIILAIVALIAGLIWFFTQTKLGKEIWKNVTDFISAAFNGLVTIIRGGVNFIVGLFQLFMLAVHAIYNNAVKPALTAIGVIFGWLWDNAIKPIVDFIVGYFQFLGAIVMWLWNNAINPAIKGIAIVVAWLWTNAIKPVVDFIVGGFKLLMTVSKNVSDFIGTVFNGIGSLISGAFKGVLNFIGGIFNTLIDMINPVLAGINQVGAAVNAATGGNIKFSIGKLPKVPSFDVGGIIPGPKGAPLLMIGHGGEPVISHDMLAGRTAMPSVVTRAAQAAIPAAAGSAARGRLSIGQVHFHTNASTGRILADLGWLTRLDG